MRVTAARSLPALAAALAAAAGCGPRREPRPAERVQLMEGLTLTQTKKGERTWTLRARTATLREDGRVAALDAPAMEFFEKGKAVSLVTAKGGEVGVESHEVRLSSSVVMDSYADKTRLDTDSLLYSPATARLSTASDVLVRRPEGELRGHGLEATPDLSEIRVHRQHTTLTETPK